MRRRSLYRLLAILSLGVSAGALLLGLVALSLAHGFEASAAGVCALVFFVPGLLFLNHWRRLYARDVALAHASALAEAEGVTDAEALGKELRLAKEDAGKILRTALREGHLKGSLDQAGRFVSSTAPQCPACGKPAPRKAVGSACPSCGAPMTGGG